MAKRTQSKSRTPSRRRGARTRSKAPATPRKAIRGKAAPAKAKRAPEQRGTATRRKASRPQVPARAHIAGESQPAPVATAGHRPDASRAERSRRTRQESARLMALQRGTLAEFSLRPRIAPRSNTESRRSGRHTVTTRAGRRSRNRSHTAARSG